MRGILEWRIVRWVSRSLREIYIIYIWPFLDEKNLCFRTKNSLMTPVFTHFVLSHASTDTTSRNIGGTDTWAAPPQMTPTIMCYVPQSFERLVPTTPSFQTRTHDPPIFQIRLIPLA